MRTNRGNEPTYQAPDARELEVLGEGGRVDWKASCVLAWPHLVRMHGSTIAAGRALGTRSGERTASRMDRAVRNGEARGSKVLFLHIVAALQGETTEGRERRVEEYARRVAGNRSPFGEVTSER